MRILFPIFLLFSFGCQKPDPNPELSDKIYSDMKAELANAEVQIAELEKKRDEMEKDMKNARPQTGDYKRAQKYYFQYLNSLNKYKQQVLYWKIRIAQRKSFTQAEYLKAFEKKQPWPDPKEYDAYMGRKKLRLAKIEWDYKQRITQSKESRQPAGQGGGHGEAKPEH